MFGGSDHVSSGTLANSFDRRSILIGGLQTGVSVLLAARMAWIGVVQNDKYATLSESNRVNLTLLPPRRGAILDRRNAQLASNRVEFRIDIIPERLADADAIVAELASLLAFDAVQVQDLRDRLEKAHGYQPIEVIAGLQAREFDKVLVRLPDLPGVVAKQGFARWYPTGPSVAHLIGYVGPATGKDYDKEKNPLLLTPGFKLGKDGLEKYYEPILRGQPGAQRVEVTASGKFVRDLEHRDDIPGKPIRLTIDGGLQDYAARRIGLESAAVVVVDCQTGGLLACCSMPAFDPNAFAGGIGRLQWKMLNEDDHIPLLNKALRGLYPPGSTMKPMATLALQQHGVDPAERIGCPGGYRLGNRFFRCDAVHGSVDMRAAIEHSCNTYFWSMAHRVGYDAIAPVARLLGLGQEFDLPGTSQRYGTIPDAAWKMRRYQQNWTAADSLNASIGQGYVSVSPLQLAVMTARIASGKNLQPSLILGRELPPGPPLPFTPDQLQVAHDGMFRVVNGAGTGTGVRIDIGGVKMAGKTGTAQVRALTARGTIGAWKTRDHSLFVCFAPADAPRYAMAVVVEHGTFGARAAAPIAKDVMTYLFDPAAAMATLTALEKGWGGTPVERMQARYRSFVAQYGTSAPRVGDEEALKATIAGADNPEPAAASPDNVPATTRPEEPAGAVAPVSFAPPTRGPPPATPLPAPAPAASASTAP